MGRTGAGPPDRPSSSGSRLTTRWSTHKPASTSTWRSRRESRKEHLRWPELLEREQEVSSWGRSPRWQRRQRNLKLLKRRPSRSQLRRLLRRLRSQLPRRLRNQLRRPPPKRSLLQRRLQRNPPKRLHLRKNKLLYSNYFIDHFHIYFPFSSLLS